MYISHTSSADRSSSVNVNLNAPHQIFYFGPRLLSRKKRYLGGASFFPLPSSRAPFRSHGDLTEDSVAVSTGKECGGRVKRSFRVCACRLCVWEVTGSQGSVGWLTPRCSGRLPWDVLAGSPAPPQVAPAGLLVPCNLCYRCDL